MLTKIEYKMKKIISSIKKRLYWKSHLKDAVNQIGAFKRTKQTTESIIDFAFRYKGMGFFSNLGLLQNRSEIINFCKTLKKQKIENLCEIGTFRGGTLFIWSQLADKKAKIFSIDLPGGPFGGGYNLKNVYFFESFLKDKQQLFCLRGDSSSLNIKKEFKKLMGTKKLDFLFIDGDHTYNGVKNDFMNYSPFVKQKGLIAFHDILFRQEQENIGVYKFWNEIKKKYKYKEFIDKENRNRPIGIGLIYK